MITLGVRDFDTSLAFYRSLGFPVHNFTEGQEFAMLRWLSLFPRDQLADDARVPDEGSGFPGRSLTTLDHPKRSIECMRSRSPAGRWGSKSRSKYSGAGIPATSVTPTVFCGK